MRYKPCRAYDLLARTVAHDVVVLVLVEAVE
jgi:hypothetical protein